MIFFKSKYQGLMGEKKLMTKSFTGKLYRVTGSYLDYVVTLILYRSHIHSLVSEIHLDFLDSDKKVESRKVEEK
jgi:hypothetical protein